MLESWKDSNFYFFYFILSQNQRGSWCGDNVVCFSLLFLKKNEPLLRPTRVSASHLSSPPSAMELNAFHHKAINLVVTPLLFAVLSIVLPFLLTFRLLVSVISRFSRENVAGKVVLITGASSGIGEVDSNSLTISINHTPLCF